MEKPANDWYRERAGKECVVSRGGSLTLSQRPTGCAGEVKHHIPLGVVDGFEGALFQKIADGGCHSGTSRPRAASASGTTLA